MRLTFLTGASALAICIATSEAMALPTALSYTGAVQTYTVPETGEYAVVVDGAQGGNSFQWPTGGGLGA
jgi:hypothetical protein